MKHNQMAEEKSKTMNERKKTMNESVKEKKDWKTEINECIDYCQESAIFNKNGKKTWKMK